MNLQEKLDLSKREVLDLSKKIGIGDQKAQVVLAIDYSGSMNSLYYSGFVQQVVQRIVPIAMAFDDNGEMEVYKFHDGVEKVKTSVTVANVEDYVKKYVMDNNMGGTNYAPTINKIVEDHTTSESGGFFSKLFGSSSKPKIEKMDLPVYVIFITDGENYDRADAEQAIRVASNHGIFFQFVGISANGRGSFSFLEKLDNMSGRKVDNANFFQISNNDLVNKSDNQLYQQLLHEYPSWLQLARQHNLIG